MALDPHRLVAQDFPEIEQDLTPRDACLYALGIGLGDAPGDPHLLSFLYEGHPGFRAAPTQPVTMGFFRWVLTPQFGIDVTRVVHGEERLTLRGPIPTKGRICARLRILGVDDKGPGRGALVSTRRDIRIVGADEAFATVETTTFCRGDGGCGSAGTTVPLSEPVPDYPPDAEVALAIGEDAALIYRLSGDDNPLHVDPEYAARAGFERPILHGLRTFATAARVIWHRLDRPSLLGRIGCRFSGVVFPGDTLRVQLWDGPDRIRFRAKVDDRTVVDGGVADFRSV